MEMLKAGAGRLVGLVGRRVDLAVFDPYWTSCRDRSSERVGNLTLAACTVPGEYLPRQEGKLCPEHMQDR